MKFFSLLLAITLSCIDLKAVESILDQSTKEAFPSEVTFETNGKKYELQATGVATRKKLFIKVYSIASYLQKDAFKPNVNLLSEILSDANAKQLTIKWVRNVDSAKIQETYLESFHKAFPGDKFAQYQAEITTFLQFFSQGVHKGDEFILRWLPTGVIEVLVNNRKTGSVINKGFALGLWDIWFGENSVVNRDGLLSIKASQN